jgi:hypothetical protein
MKTEAMRKQILQTWQLVSSKLPSTVEQKDVRKFLN